MNIFIEKPDTKIGTTLTKQQFDYLKYLFWNVKVDGVHHDINNEETLEKLVAKVSFEQKHFYGEDTVGFIELDNETLTNLIKSYGKLTRIAEVEEELTIMHYEEFELPDHFASEEEVLELECDDLVTLGYEVPMLTADDADYRETRVNHVLTKLTLQLPLPSFYADTDEEKEEAA